MCARSSAVALLRSVVTGIAISLPLAMLEFAITGRVPGNLYFLWLGREDSLLTALFWGISSGVLLGCGLGALLVTFKKGPGVGLVAGLLMGSFVLANGFFGIVAGALSGIVVGRIATMGASQLEAATSQGERWSGSRYAGFWLRLAAVLVDLGALNFIVVFLGCFSIWLGVIAGVLFMVANGIVSFGRYGQTLGEAAAAIRVVREDGSPLGYRDAFDRNVFTTVTNLPLCLGSLWVALDRRKQGLCDKLADTLAWRLEPAHISPRRARGAFVAASAIAVSMLMLALTAPLWDFFIEAIRALDVSGGVLPAPTRLLVQVSSAVTTRYYVGAWVLPGMISILVLVASGRCPLPGRRAVWIALALAAVALAFMVAGWLLPIIGFTHSLQSGAFGSE